MAQVKQMFLKVAATMLLSCFGFSVAFAQHLVRGTVKDVQGEPVIGASVMVVGHDNLGAVTDLDGKYSLSVPDGTILSVSCVGYKTVNEAVGNRSEINFVIEEDSEFLEETVVIG